MLRDLALQLVGSGIGLVVVVGEPPAIDTVLVRVGAREPRGQVRLIEGDERAAAWQRALDYRPGYQLEHCLADGRGV